MIALQEEAITAFRQAYDKTVALSYRMDVVFYLLRIGLFYCNHELIRSNLEKAQRYGFVSSFPLSLPLLLFHSTLFFDLSSPFSFTLPIPCSLSLSLPPLFLPCSLVEEGGDWDRRNRLKVYRGVYAMQIRDFKTAATNFFDAVATFTSTELMDYQTFVKYAVFCCMVSLPRGDLKSKVQIGSAPSYQGLCMPGWKWRTGSDCTIRTYSLTCR